MENSQVNTLSNDQNSSFDQASMQYHSSQHFRTMSDLYMKSIKKGAKYIEDFYDELKKMSVIDSKALLYTYNIMMGRSWENVNFDDDDYKNIFVKELQKWEYPIVKFNEILDTKAMFVVPDSYLDWFRDDLRSSIFIMNLIHGIFDYAAFKGRDELLNAITNYLPYNIAFFNSSTNNKFGYFDPIQVYDRPMTTNLLSIKSTYLKGRTKDKELRWLDPSNHNQIEWAYDYLNDKDGPIILQGIFFPENIEDKHDLILAHLDSLSNIESPEIGTKENKGFSLRSYTLYKMKKAWDGRKNHESKVQANNGNIKIYKKNQSKLKELVKYNKVATNKLVNKFIEDAYENYTANCSGGAQELDQHTSNECNNVKGKDKRSGSTSSADPTQTEPTSAINQSKRRIPLKSRATPTARVTNQNGESRVELRKFKERSRD